MMFQALLQAHPQYAVSLRFEFWVKWVHHHGEATHRPVHYCNNLFRSKPTRANPRKPTCTGGIRWYVYRARLLQPLSLLTQLKEKIHLICTSEKWITMTTKAKERISAIIYSCIICVYSGLEGFRQVTLSQQKPPVSSTKSILSQYVSP